MSTLREAAQQALNALSCIEYGMCGITEGPSDDTTVAAIDALRAALAQEPQTTHSAEQERGMAQRVERTCGQQTARKPT